MNIEDSCGKEYFSYGLSNLKVYSNILSVNLKKKAIHHKLRRVFTPFIPA
jgi:hypothetical protein